MTEQNRTDITETAAFIKAHLDPKLVDIGDQKILILPAGTAPHSVKKLLAEYQTKPERIIGTAKHATLESFTDHVIRFSDKESALFAHRDPENPQLLAVYDYHPTVPEESGVAAVEARFGQHCAVYPFPVSDEWKTWTESDGDKMTQAAFAEFLENNVHNVADPLSALESTKPIMESLLCSFASPGRLMELARGLTVRVESMVANAQKLGSGESTLRYDTQHTDEKGAPLDVPGAFLLSIPVFQGGDRYQIAARLRYRVEGSKVSWLYQLHLTEESFNFAFEEACKKAKEDTGLPLFYGQPEGAKP